MPDAERDAYIMAVARQIGAVCSEIEALIEKRERLTKELAHIINREEAHMPDEPDDRSGLTIPCIIAEWTRGDCEGCGHDECPFHGKGEG